MKKLTIIKPRWILTVNEQFDLLTDSALVIEDDIIKSIHPVNELHTVEGLDEAKTVILDNHILMPGLINTHTHAAMSLLRGIADDLPLMDWLNNHIWPAESKWIDRQFIQDGVKLCVAEMIRSGTTCLNDMYFFPDIMAKTCQQMGMRATTGLIVLDFPTVWAQSADEYLSKAMAVIDEVKEYPLISTAFAPHAPYTVSDKPLEKIAMYSSELDIQVHMHIHETQFEVDESVKNIGKRPLERLDQLNLLNPNLMAVHMTSLNELEMERIAETGVHVVHCPESNLKLASGFCPVDTLQKLNINICLGTDGAASNNDLDMFGEMRTAALLSKGISGNASSCNAEQSLRMATINGAKALGLADQIGSLEAGKKADVIAVDFSQLNTQPVYDPIAQLVYATNSMQVSHVWINGEQKLKDYQLTDIDAVEIISTAQQWQDKIQEP
ncbi:MAG: TRZ/ATZ family hydrolase [Gammaproteobacteria bacterium]|jgi:5-methylthioadenosine/S-adenosylhomocysteine deaminase|nr:TRZ/ATZ family hydrolase [Gammaproteobacteria bacterium]MBT4861859.1 TRZ/ATZ family hydrolase [Gammaproteobacteria bacterium]MBT6551527.1 TRZ/ATZ family hydrolase [Gammaproteobacteria bacterium]MBT6702542.1 TRZ/ATZ family hydrolase [Gammaproteobacteria bacterium]